MKRNQLCGCLHYRPVMGRAAEHVQMSSTRVLPGSHFERPLSEFQVLPDCGRKISLDESRRARTARGLERSSDAEHTGRPTARQAGRQAGSEAGRPPGRPTGQARSLSLSPCPLTVHTEVADGKYRLQQWLSPSARNRRIQCMWGTPRLDATDVIPKFPRKEPMQLTTRNLRGPRL